MPIKPSWMGLLGKLRGRLSESSQDVEDLEGDEAILETHGESPEAGSPPVSSVSEAGAPPVLSSSGEPSTFASKPWWKSDWWLLDISDIFSKYRRREQQN